MSRHIATRFHIGENIRAAEGIDGLLGVADKQQRRLRLLPPDTAKNSVLLRVGVLKFINHRHRETLTNGAGQRFSALAAQRIIQPTEHVIKTELAAPTLFPGDRFADLHHRPGDNQIRQRQRRREQLFNRTEQRMHRRLTAGFSSFM